MIYSFKFNTLDGKPMNLADYRGKVMLLVNVASHCGFTPQYAGLEQLYQRYRDQGLIMIGFPCNQFGAQEPGDAQEIRDFCTQNYGVTFPLSEKIAVNGENAHSLYRYLTQTEPGILGTQAIKWNFTKFLVDRQGRVVQRYAPMTKPEAMALDIEALL